MVRNSHVTEGGFHFDHRLIDHQRCCSWMDGYVAGTQKIEANGGQSRPRLTDQSIGIHVQEVEGSRTGGFPETKIIEDPLPGTDV